MKAIRNTRELQPGRTLLKRSLHLDADFLRFSLEKRTHALKDIPRREETWLRRETLSGNFDALFSSTGHRMTQGYEHSQVE